MNRRVLVSTVALCTALLPLSGCQAAVEHFGPQPDSALLALADAAQHDSRALRASNDAFAAEGAQLRAQQAEELYAEIARLCGLREDGTPPSSCEVTRAPAAEETKQGTQEWAQQALRSLEQAAGDGSIPEESRPLVVAQAVDMAALVTFPAPAKSVSISPQQRAAAEELLEWEYAQLFGLDFARSYASPEMEKDIDQRLEMHERRVLVLQAALRRLAASPDASTAVPQPRPAYTTPAGQNLPVDAATARSFVDALGWNDTLKWEQAATEAALESTASGKSSGTEKANLTSWLDWLIRTAGRSAAL